MSTENEHNHFTFNGRNSLDLHLYISKYPDIPVARKRIDEIVVPGMDGVLHQSDGSYEPVRIRYKCWFVPNPENPLETLADRAHIISEWLGMAPAGAELRDSYDTTIYRRATYVGGSDIRSLLGVCGTFDVEFSCDPRAYLESGRDWEVSPGAPVGIPNSTGHDAHPLLHITCAGSGTVEFQARKGDDILKKYTIEINFPSNLAYEFTFDCAIGESWGFDGGNVVSFNRWLTVAELPVIHPGPNDITVTGGVAHAQVDMRWWKL